MPFPVGRLLTAKYGFIPCTANTPFSRRLFPNGLILDNLEIDGKAYAFIYLDHPTPYRVD